MSERFDIVVAGGGQVGGVFANLAALAGYRVAVADASGPPQLDDGDTGGARVVALSRGSERLLRRIGAWNEMAAGRRGAYERMRIWDAHGDPFDRNALVFDCADIGAANLGHIVENDAIVAAVFAMAQRNDAITWLSASVVTAIHIGDDEVRVDLAQGGTLVARLLVAADGARSACRALLDMPVDGGAYEQAAVVSHLETGRPHKNTAFQRFLDTGPLAFLPLADGRSSLVWSTGVAEARRLLALDEAAFCTRVTQASAGVLAEVSACSRRLSFPLNWLHARHYCQPRFVMIGDAAHCVHPLAGQGVNLGLLDAATLTQVLTNAAVARRDIGDMSVLRRYERWRKSENAAMLGAFSRINRLFVSPDSLVASVRRTGLGLVNRIGPLKRNLMLRAMGVRGDLPDLVMKS